jgi:hypothetical protein
VYSWEKTAVRIDEPKSHTLESLCHAMVDGFKAEGFKVGVLYSKSNNILKIRLGQPDIRIQLLASFNRLLGLPENCTISTPLITIFLPKVFKPAIAKETSEKQVEWRDREKMYVQCKTVEP